MNPLRLRLVVVLFFVIGLSASAAAQQPLQRVLDLNRQAMDAYTNLDLEHAEDLLEQAAKVAERNDVSGPPRARTYLNLGVIYTGGYQDNARGMRYFKKALEADSEIELDPLTSTPDIREVFELAKRQAGTRGGGSSSDGASSGRREGNIPHEPVPEQLRQAAIPVYVELPDDEVSEVLLYYKGQGMRSFEEAEMQPVAEGYGFEIPCDSVFAPAMEYYIVALGADGSRIGYAGSEQSPIEVPVVDERSQPPPALPGQPPPEACSLDSECPPGMPCDNGGGKGLGDTCRVDGDCREGLACEDNFCAAGGGGDSDGGGDGDAPRFFAHIGFSSGLGFASSGMQADGQPENKMMPPGSYIPSGEGGCDAPEGQYCVRVEQSGFLFAPALRATFGYYIIDRIAVAATLRYQFNAGQGTMANMLLGLRGQFRLTPPVAEGLDAAVHLGTSFGQIQLQPPQNGAPEPYIISGLNGVQLGGTVAYRFLKEVGVYATPELHVLFPTFLFAIDLTFGVEVGF